MILRGRTDSGGAFCGTFLTRNSLAFLGDGPDHWPGPRAPVSEFKAWHGWKLLGDISPHAVSDKSGADHRKCAVVS